MKRREFINTGFLTLSGMLIGRNFTFANAMEETSESFKNIGNNTYDLIINGAGLNGFFTALEATKRNLKVLIVDKRTSPGYDIAAKRKLWLQTNGIEKWDESLLDLFFPEGELEEMFDKELFDAPRNSRAGDELLLFAGSLKKGMLRSLLINKVDVLLMTDVCGIVSDKKNNVSGVVVASKQGLFSINCNSFIDATDHNLFTRDLFHQEYKISNAGFVLELEKIGNISDKSLLVSETFGILNNEIKLHKGKKVTDQHFLEYQFSVKENDLSAIEQKARSIAFEICKNLPNINPSFSKAKLRYYALECSFNVEGKMGESFPLKNYSYIENPSTDYSCHSILQMMETAQNKVAKIKESSIPGDKIFVHYIGGKVPFKGTKETICENGQSLPLSPFPVNTLNLHKKDTSILVVGGGTAGAMAAFGAVQKGFQPTVVEYFNDLGGTRTMGGVLSYYYGYQDHKIIRQLGEEIRQISENCHMRTTMPLCFNYLNKLLKNNCQILNGNIFCGAQVVNKQLKSITVCENGKLMQLNAKITIDATGDGDVAYYSGEGYEIGDSRMSITQNYSQWNVPFRPKVNNYRGDYDIIDCTEISELQRGLYLSHYESHYYDFYPMLTVRESRRPNGMHKLDTMDILNEVCFEDTIAQARSDFDPHYFASSEYSRCGFLLPHFDNESLINIPYRSIVPKTIDGLLLSGKAIGQSSTALQFTRMSADVTVLGYVTGLIAAEIVKEGVQARNFSVKNIQKELINDSYLPEKLNIKKKYTVRELVDRLSAGDADYLPKCCLEDQSPILPLLKTAFDQNKHILLAKSLAWFGNIEGIDLIIKELIDLFTQEQLIGHPNTYYEKYDSKTLYWKINQDIALLGMANNEKSNSLINQILKKTQSGGKRVPAPDDYNQSRIDLNLVPFFNRILNLCFYIERNPDREFASGLNALLEDKHLTGYKSNEYNQARWRLYGANLELYIASAASRCGSKKGIDRLIDYLSDVHSTFRHFAHGELVAIFHKDFEYEAYKWSKYADQNIRISYKETPLIKKIEY